MSRGYLEQDYELGLSDERFGSRGPCKIDECPLCGETPYVLGGGSADVCAACDGDIGMTRVA